MFTLRSLLISGLLCAAMTQALTGKFLRILPLGDSITAGAYAIDQGGYRGPLVGKLDGNYVNMVGSNYDGTFRDANHEGWGGFPTPYINRKFEVGAKANSNVVLVHSGTNDVLNVNVTAQDALDRLAVLLDNIKAKLPDTITVVAQIIRNLDTTVNDKVVAYNNGIPSLVFARGGSMRIRLVNMYPVLSDGDFYDDTHPNAGGYVKMADKWLEALNNISSDSSSSSWYANPPTPANQPGGIGALICPVATTAPNTAGPTPITIEFDNGAILPVGANKQNIFFGVSCQAAGTTQCSCTDPSAPTSAQSYAIALPSGRSCSDLNTPRTAAVQFADVNGDGLADYLYVEANGSVTSWLTTGTGGGDKSAQISITSQNGGNSIFPGVPASGFTATSTRSQIRLADLDGDGRAEILYVHPSGNVIAYQANPVLSTLNTQSGPTYTNRGNVFNGSSSGFTFPGAGIQFADLNGDGRADLLYIGVDGGIVAFQNGGPFGPSSYTNFGPATPIFPSPGTLGGLAVNRDTVIIKDINGDGKADLIIVDRATAAFKAYLNVGASGNNFASFNTSTPRIDRPAIQGNDGGGLQFADFGGNGRASLVLVSPSTSGLATFTNVCVINAPTWFNDYS